MKVNAIHWLYRQSWVGGERVNDKPEIESNSDENAASEDVAKLHDTRVINEKSTAQNAEENLVINNNANDLAVDPLAIGDLHDLNVCADVKVEPLPIYDNHFANDSDIENVLDEPIEEICDDIVIVIGRSGIPKPLRMTNEQTIKRENDKMSGNLTFSVSVRFFLVDKKYQYSLFNICQLKTLISLNRRARIVWVEFTKSAKHWSKFHKKSLTKSSNGIQDLNVMMSATIERYVIHCCYHWYIKISSVHLLSTTM